MDKADFSPTEGDGKISTLGWGEMGGGDAKGGTTVMEKIPQQLPKNMEVHEGSSDGTTRDMPLTEMISNLEPNESNSLTNGAEGQAIHTYRSRGLQSTDSNWSEIQSYIDKVIMQKIENLKISAIEEAIKRFSDTIMKEVIKRIQILEIKVLEKAQICSSDDSSSETTTVNSTEKSDDVSSEAFTSRSSGLDSSDDQATFKKRKAMKAKNPANKTVWDTALRHPKTQRAEMGHHRSGPPLADQLTRPPPGYTAQPRYGTWKPAERHPARGQRGQIPVYPPIHLPRKQYWFDGHARKKTQGLYPSGNGPNTLGTKEVKALARIHPQNCLKCGAIEAHFARECPIYTGPMGYCWQCKWYHEGQCKGY